MSATALRVLVVDDDAGVRYTLREILEAEGLAVEEAGDGADALALWEARPAPLVVTDLRMPGMDGMALLRALAARPHPPRVVVITAHGSERQAVEAMKAGAHDYFRKPFETEELLAVVRRALDAVRLADENERLAGELALARTMVFVSEPMRRLAVLVARVAPRDVTVLVTGESGTGKERVAEAIVQASRRADRPFVRFNCAALTPELAEAELFGHARGAFTGATRARPGLFGEADGGTILLDEVGELAPGTQAKLLRVLQEGEIRAVGDERVRTVDVRVLAATHRDLAEEVRAGRFREDLWYRLDVVHLHVPPLRERPEDVPVLARHFLARFAERFGAPSLHAEESLLHRLAGLPSTPRRRCSTGSRGCRGPATSASWSTPSSGSWRSPRRRGSTSRSSRSAPPPSGARSRCASGSRRTSGAWSSRRSAPRGGTGARRPGGSASRG